MDPCRNIDWVCRPPPVLDEWHRFRSGGWVL